MRKTESQETCRKIDEPRKHYINQNNKLRKKKASVLPYTEPELITFISVYERGWVRKNGYRL